MTSSLQKSAVPEKRIALLAGPTGLVGGRLLRLLLEAPDYGRVHALSRRPLTFDHARLANRILPLETVGTALKGLKVDDAFCCLGSTVAVAGSDAARRRVDVDLVLAFAEAAFACGAQRFIVLSSAGADPASARSYLADKGDLERRLRAFGFASLDILRPGLLLGWRAEPRPAELLGAALSPILNPLLWGRRAIWRAINATDVAKAMLAAARSRRRGVYVYSGPGLKALANQ
jgi:uncharacterized protein YbjT (DUF2867 family)